jgi:hypothetical protein
LLNLSVVVSVIEWLSIMPLIQMDIL